jgi:predicted flap endonuclease-1-like 5' DNA nuclease/DNA repair exonuclease SbcCD ATPase subunit
LKTYHTNVTNNFLDADSERDALKGQLITLEQSYNGLKNTHDALQNTHNQNVMMLKTLEKAAKENHNSWEGRFNDLEKAHLALENQYSNLDASFQAKDANLAALQKASKDWQAERNALRGQYAALESAAMELQQDLENRYGRLQGEYEELNQRYAEVSNEYKSHQVNFQNLEKATSDNHTVWDTKYNNLQYDYDVLRDQYVNLEKQRNGDKANWETKYNELQGRYSDLEDQHNTQLNDYQQVQRVGSESQAMWQTKIAAIQNDYDVLRRQYDALQKVANEHQTDLQTRYDALQKEFDNQNINYRNLERVQHEGAQTWSNRYTQLMNDYNALRTDFNIVKQSGDTAAKDLAARYTLLQSDYDELHNRLTNAETSGSDATKMAEKHQMTIRDLEKRFGELSNEYKALKSKTDKAEKVNKKLNDALQELEASGNRQIGGWQDKYDQLALSYEESDANVAALKQNLANVQMALDAQKAAKEREIADYQSKLHAMEINLSNFNALNQQYDAILKERDNYLREHNNWKNQYVSLENEVHPLRLQLNESVTQYGKVQNDVEDYKKRYETTQEALTEAEAERDALTRDYERLNQFYLNATRKDGGLNARYEGLLTRMRESENLITNLKLELDAYRAHPAFKTVSFRSGIQHSFAENPTMEASVTNVKSDEAAEIEFLMKLRTLIGKLNFDVMGRADENEKEDLSGLTGMDERTRRRLYALGIFTYRQWANMNADDHKWLREYLSLNPSWDWVQEARHILGWNQGDKKDDLKIVEGIGPKIEQLLFAEGIFTFKQLAATTPERIKAILKAAGPRYRIHNPTTWPGQADMAAKGEWDRLKQYQAYLNAGRDLG